MRSIVSALLVGCLAGPVSAQAPAQKIDVYVGACDASAAVSLTEELFVVGNDEDNTLQTYRRGQPLPIRSLPLSEFLDTGPHEADIEGAARLGSRIYWIASHSRNGKGEIQRSRHRLFATDIGAGQPPVLKAVGKPYSGLLQDLVNTEALKPLGLKAAARLAAEADGGLNIEGLAATPEGGLLIGFRNPLRARHALVVPLQNPGEVIEGRHARLGAAIELDLGGRGIRSIELVGSAYLIVAGPTADQGSFALYRWSGKATEAPTLVADLTSSGTRPEALMALPQSARVQLLSDDGGILVDGIECKKLPKTRQSFRSYTLEP
jgi:hypothetical protein